jgi:menaquinone-dependent protoporphyrinogen oxidase
MKVLITTASKHGSTEEIGARIGSVLNERGHEVEVRCPSEVRDVARYDVVVLGSAVYAGHWQKDAKELVDREAPLLRHRPVWLFSSGPVGDPPKPQEVPADVEDVVAATGAFEHHVFAGRIEKSTLSMPERAVVKAFRVAEGDFRDWNEIDQWATTIADSISSG